MNPAVQDAITRAAEEEGVDPAFALATAERESNFNPNAHNSRTIFGLYQMSGGLRSQYGAGDSADPYTQAKAWARFINDTKAGLAQRIGREPTNDELYLAHYFGEGRAARMIGGGIAPSTSVQDVFTPTELAANPNIARAGTVGALTSSIGTDMERRQAKFGGFNPGLNPDFASFGQPEDGASPELTYKSTSPDFASFGVSPNSTQTGSSQPIDFAQFGQQASELQGPGGNPNQGGSNSQTVPGAAQNAPDNKTGGAVGLIGAELPGGSLPLFSTTSKDELNPDLAATKKNQELEAAGFRPSTNVEDDRNTSVLGKLANKFNAQMGGTWENPDTAGQEVDVSQFGLPDTATALSKIAPPAAPLPEVPVTGL